MFMGRIRPALIKKISIRLVEENPELFTADFEHNKKVLKELNLIPSKKIRNKVAGYIVRTIRKKKF